MGGQVENRLLIDGGGGGQKNEGKAISFPARTGTEDSRRLRLPDFKTIGT